MALTASPIQDVRRKNGVPILGDFYSSAGTPLVIDITNGTISFIDENDVIITIPDNSFSLDDLSDVIITSPGTGSTIIWNGSEWVDGYYAMPDGTVSAPGLPYINDPDTGFWRDTANYLSTATGGTQNLELRHGGGTPDSYVWVNNWDGGAEDSGPDLSVDGAASDIALFISSKGNGLLYFTGQNLGSVVDLGPFYFEHGLFENAQYTNNSDGPDFVFYKSRNTSLYGNTVVQSGDQLGVISFKGSDGTNFEVGAEIKAEVDGTPGNNDMPGRIVLSTTADGANSLTERLRITNAGAWGLAGTNYGTSGQVLTSGGSSAAPTWESASVVGSSSPLRTVWVDDFMTGANSALAWKVVQSGTPALDVRDGLANHPGILEFATGGTNTDGYGITMADGTTGGPILGTDVEYFCFVFQLPTTLSTLSFKCGLTQNHTIATAGDWGTDGVWFEFIPATSGSLTFNVRSGSSSATPVSTVTISANTWYQVEATRDSGSGAWTPRVNGVDYTAVSTNLPSIAINPAIYLSITTSSTRKFWVDYFSMYTKALSSRY